MTGETTGLSDADLERITADCHSAVWFLQRSSGEQLGPTPHLGDAPEWAVESTEDSIRAVWGGATMEQLWRHWADAKIAAGWVRGDVKNQIARTHPCLVDDYSELSEREKHKDRVFTGVVLLARRGQLPGMERRDDLPRTHRRRPRAVRSRPLGAGLPGRRAGRQPDRLPALAVQQPLTVQLR